MRIRSILLVALVLIIAVIGTRVHSMSKLALLYAAMQDPNMTKLQWLAAQAQANGQTKVDLIASLVMHNDVQNLDQAINDYTIVVAQPVSQKGYPDSASVNVETWYKFSVTEYLSRKPPADCTGCSPLTDPPADLLPLNSNEILVPRSGGDLVVNGVTIMSVDAEFPSFLHSQQYLLFLDLNSSTGVGAVKAGPIGAFAVNGDQLVPLDENPHPLKDDLANRYGNSLSQLRNALNPPPPPPPPSSCDPTGSKQRYCDSHLGDWDPSTCTCYNACATPSKPYLCY